MYTYILYVDVWHRLDDCQPCARIIGAFTSEAAMNEYMDKNPATDDNGNKDGEAGWGWNVQYRTESTYIIA